MGGGEGGAVLKDMVFKLTGSEMRFSILSFSPKITCHSVVLSKMECALRYKGNLTSIARNIENESSLQEYSRTFSRNNTN